MKVELIAGFIFQDSALNTNNSFGLVDVNANFYYASLSTFWVRLQKIRVQCHDQVTEESQGKFMLNGL